MFLRVQTASIELAWYWWVLIGCVVLSMVMAALRAWLFADARAILRYSQFLARMGKPQRAEAILLAALQRLPLGPNPDRQFLMTALQALRQSPFAFVNGLFPGASGPRGPISPSNRDINAILLELRERAAQGRHDDDVESLWNQYVETARSLAGDSSGEYATAQSDRAITLEAIGRYAEARRDYEGALRIWKQRGDEQFFVVGLINAGDLLRQMGAYEDSREHLSQALTMLPGLYGAYSSELASEEARCRLHLGLLHEDLGELDTAIDMLSQAHQLALRGHPPGDWRTGSILRHLSRIETTAGHYDAAEAHAAEAMAIKSARFGTGTPLTDRWRDISGRPLMARGRWQEAIVHLQAAHDARVALREHSLEAILIQDVLGDARAGAGRYAEALAIKQDVARRWDQFGASVFEAVPEPCRMTVLAQMARSQASLISLVMQQFSFDQQAVRSAFDIVCKRKGLGLELLCLQRDAASRECNPGISGPWARFAL